MATLDEGVVNLQRFIGLLASATSATEQVGDHVKESSRRFTELESQAEEEGGGLNDGLSELALALETEEAEAVAAITELTQAAAGAQDAASGARDKVEQAAADLEANAAAVENRLQQASALATSDGFEPLGQALEEAGQEMDAESQEAEQAFTELESAVGGFESEAETAWSAAESEIDEAITAIADGEAALEAESTEDVDGFDSAAGTLEAACTALQGDVDLIYDVLAQGVEAQGQAWQQAVQAAAHEALDFVTDARQHRMDQPGAMVDDEALATLRQEYEAVDAMLAAALVAVNDVPLLAEELVKCHGVLVDIDALMEALAQ